MLLHSQASVHFLSLLYLTVLLISGRFNFWLLLFLFTCLPSVGTCRCDSAKLRLRIALLCLTLLNTRDPLHDHRRSRTAAIANSCNAILARLQLMQQSRQDPRARTSQSMAQGDSTTKQIDFGGFETQNLSHITHLD
jgi:hypothetical protein